MSQNFNPQLIKEFLNTLPSQVQNFNQQLIQDLQPKLEQWLSSLNLVSRQEFDLQTKRLNQAKDELSEIKLMLAELQLTSPALSKSSDELENADASG